MRGIRLACLIAVLSGAAAAEVTKIEIRARDEIGAFERIVGKAYYAVDPKAAANQAITDIALAPKNADGKVEFSGDFMIVRPRDPAKSRGSVFLEVPNRGGPQSNYVMMGGHATDSLPEHWDLGDRFPLEQGFTMAFVGWQFDVTARQGMSLSVPTVPVEGLVREPWIQIETGQLRSIFPVRYCAADAEEADARLTLRQKINEPGMNIDRRAWRFVASGCAVQVTGGLNSGLYEAVYHAKNPAVAGLGFAAIRDFAAYLKNGPKNGELRENPAELKRVIGYGYSQSARFLRELVRDGFNQDEHGRAAFDGLMIQSAGAGIGSFNHRFAVPGDAGNSVLSILRPVDVPPFTDDGLLAKAETAKVTPKIFYTFTSTEYWARAGSLTHTTPDGKTDVPLSPKSRLYFITGTAHSSGPFPPRKRTSSYDELHYMNFAQQDWVARAFMIDLDEWIGTGKEPPASIYPKLAKSELVPRDLVKFPKSPAIPFPPYMPHVWKMDFGSEFASKGIAANEPPALGVEYAVLVPQVDENGNDRGGIRIPEVAVPLGTFTGWNFQQLPLANLDYLSGLIGSFEPLPVTRADKSKAGDARKSIEEMYPSREDYLDRVRHASQDLVKQRLMMEKDVDDAVRRAAAMWDWVTSSARLEP
jgi:hypothetical protein